MDLHKKKVFFITAGVITLVALAGILALLLNISAFKPQIEAAASAALEMDVRIKGRVGIALFPGFGLSLKDVSVRNKGLDVITIEKMRIGLKLVSLARFKIKIIEVGLVRPIFSILRSKNGMFNLKKPGRSSWEKLFAVEKVSIAQGSLVYTESYNFTNLYAASQGGKGSIRKLVSIWKVKNGIAEARDVALASKKQRIAMKGGLNLIKERFVDVTVAALDKRGCAVYTEKVHGPFRKPQVEKESIFKSIAGSVLNPLEDVWKFFQGKECTVFYAGSVAQPEG